jgi:hypothetical protein
MTPARRSALLATATALTALAACGHSSPGSDVSLHDGALAVRNGQVVIAGANGTEARVSSDGRLTIGGEEVAVSDAQRAQLVTYAKAATAVVQDAAATGVAGAAVGATAANGIVAGLAKGDLSDLKTKIESQAGEVERQALKLCDDLMAMRAAQQALTAELAAFRPYAVISEHDAADCAKSRRSASTSQAATAAPRSLTP